MVPMSLLSKGTPCVCSEPASDGVALAIGSGFPASAAIAVLSDCGGVFSAFCSGAILEVASFSAVAAVSEGPAG